MWEYVSLRRDAAGLATAAAELRALGERGPIDRESANMLIAGRLIVAAATARAESRGGHYRTDCPDRDPARDGRHTLLAPADAASACESVAEQNTAEVVSHA
jgi:L-aspartate oxidase